MGTTRYLLAGAALFIAALGVADPVKDPTPLENSDGSLNVPAFVLPFSAYASAEAKVEQSNKFARIAALAALPSPANPTEAIAQHRLDSDRLLFKPWLEAQRNRYAVRLSEQMISGVTVQVFTPNDGVQHRNKDRVLINLHGGAFVLGWGMVSQIESIPVAAVAGIKVISVNYRMFPEAKFPAASEDVTAVYRELLKTYKPSQIGVYGCSAGGILTSQAIAWFIKEHLPLPAAIAILSAPLDPRFSGDSAYITSHFGSFIATPKGDGIEMPYFDGATSSDPMVSPAASPEILKQFPPTFLISGTRAGDMSSMTHAHLQLLSASVDARLALWDGVDHCFMYNPDLPESQQVYTELAKFFAKMMRN